MANSKLPGLPGWIKASLWVVAGLVVVAIIMIALGHNPLQHLMAHGGMTG